MSDKSYKSWLVASISVAAIGVLCFIVKFIELSMREAHAWAQTFVVLGIVFLGVALLMLVAVIICSNILEKKQANKPQQTDEEILAKYRKR